MVALQRVSMGFHSFFDAVIGSIIGFSIGFISWITLEHFKKSHNQLCKEKEEKEEKDINKDKSDDICKNYKFYTDEFIKNGMGISRIILTIPVLYLLFKFLTNDVFKLAAIKH